jgi:hypothetical protein
VPAAEHGDHETHERDGAGVRSATPRKVALLALAAVLLMVQACREDEQNRPLVPDKGTYQGQPDEKLDQDQIEALRQRATGHQL